MMIKLTQASNGFDGYSEDSPLWVNACLISTVEEDEFGTLILIPPYQKPIKVRETLKKIITLINNAMV